MVRHMKCGLWGGVAAVVALSWAAPVWALAGGTTYPRLLCYSSRLNEMPESWRAQVAKYDVVVELGTIRPEMLADLQRYNPRIRVLAQVQPQYAVPMAGGDWWVADTTWSINRRAQFYCSMNDWYLRDIYGRPIELGGGTWLVNWTRYCPIGRYGSSKGLRASQWYARMLGDIAGKWRWDSKNTPNGIMFEILADCLGSYGHLEQLALADPDRDGVAEWVSASCSVGGAAQPLSVLMRTENWTFWSELSHALPVEVPLLINENNDYIGPYWRRNLSGMKLENWMASPVFGWTDYWDSPKGFGYEWAEKHMRRGGNPRLYGWDMSIVRTAQTGGIHDERMFRLGLGTALLGDGFFQWSLDDRTPQWRPEFDRSLGVPTGGYRKIAVGPDTLYARWFTKGNVVVNPNKHMVGGIAAEDARITWR